MLKRVKITDSGDTTLLIGEAVEKGEFIKTNQQVISEGGQPAQAEPLLLGITRASLSTKVGFQQLHSKKQQRFLLMLHVKERSMDFLV